MTNRLYEGATPPGSSRISGAFLLRVRAHACACVRTLVSSRVMSDSAELMMYQRAQALPETRRGEFMMVYQTQKKNRTTAFVLSFFLGYFGIDRFYLGQVGLGLAKLFTFGGLWIWWFIDLFLIMSATDRQNEVVVAKLTAMYAR